MSPDRVVPRELAPGVEIGGAGLPVIAGPCVIETEEIAMQAAEAVAQIARRLNLQLIFKASFDKANRSSIRGFRGPGLQQGLRILAEIRRHHRLHLLTDVHEPAQCEAAAAVVDVLQIPAFLCRQTDLLLAAARTGRAVNVKKGQFTAPDDMRRVVEKIRSAGNERVTVTERGVSFGYHNLVVDMRSFAWMQRDGVPVIYDVTHSLQLPGAGDEGTGGAREFAEPLARAAVAAGADGLFLEVHPDPANAMSDRETQLAPDRAEALLASLLPIRAAVLEAGR
ncbi:MAG: 3-deoxy-8-phosphooctulonate synthase [Thermoanaerobaculia bacterium]